MPAQRPSASAKCKRSGELKPFSPPSVLMQNRRLRSQPEIKRIPNASPGILTR
jgi:hypothetical protein